MRENLELKQAYATPPEWPTHEILPDGFLPMLPSTAGAPPENQEYAFEVKWEGLRTLAGLESSQLKVRTAAEQDVRFWFPELDRVRAAAKPAWVLLDGELVIIKDDRVRPELLQQRLRAPDYDTVQRLAREIPARFIVYDILRIGDSWLLDVTWEDRREILERAVHATPTVQLSPVRAEAEPATRLARDLGLDAILAKRLRGRYSPGQRTRDWLSIRPSEYVYAVIGGWTEGRGARTGTIGSLLLGMYHGDRLEYIGHTGTGLDQRTLPLLHEELQRLQIPRSPFTEEPALPSPPHWVRPELVCRIRHQGWSATGQMRAPTFVELALDRSPTECQAPDTASSGVHR